MGKAHSPRHGSMQFWPRKRARSQTPRIRNVKFYSGSKVDGFYGYKVGMAHVTIKDSYANSLTKNQIIVKPVSIIECPALRVAGIRFYKIKNSCLSASGDFFADKLDKELSKKMIVPKAKDINVDDYDDIRLIVYTMPKLTMLSKKKPEVFELYINGSKEEKLAFAKEKLGKEIDVSEVFKPSQHIDIHAVTKGKGNQGPVKRFGVQIRHHKSEKTKRGAGSLGPWCGQPHIMYRIAHSGQTGYHLRTEYNKPVIYIGKEIEKVNPAGGIARYGLVKNTYIMVLGSIPGPRKRMLRLTHPMKPTDNNTTDKLKLLKVYV